MNQTEFQVNNNIKKCGLKRTQLTFEHSIWTIRPQAKEKMYPKY